jgi:hypothetical protein
MEPYEDFSRLFARIFFERKAAIESLNTHIHLCWRRLHDTPELTRSISGESSRSVQSDVEIAGFAYGLPASCQFKANAAYRPPIQFGFIQLSFEPR